MIVLVIMYILAVVILDVISTKLRQNGLRDMIDDFDPNIIHICSNDLRKGRVFMEEFDLRMEMKFYITVKQPHQYRSYIKTRSIKLY